MDQGKSPELANADPYHTFDFPDGKIAFVGLVRVNDYGIHEFRVELAGRPHLFGEWRPKFEPNGNDFGVEVRSFGYVSPDNVGNPHPDARKRLFRSEVEAAQRLVIALFGQTETRGKFVPFSMEKARFTDAVEFRFGWIME